MNKTLTWIFFTLTVMHYSTLSAIDFQIDPEYLKKNPGTKITFGKGGGNGCVTCNSPGLNSIQRSKLNLSGEKKFVTDRRKNEVWLVVNGKTIWTRQAVYICDSNEILELIPKVDSAEILFVDGKKATVDQVGNVNCLSNELENK